MFVCIQVIVCHSESYTNSCVCYEMLSANFASEQCNLAKHCRMFSIQRYCTSYIVNVMYTCIGNIHQFDTMIYPEQRNSGWSSRIFGSARNFKVKEPFKMRKLCMNVYLEPYKRMLHSGEFVPQENFDISIVVTYINHLFMCCGNQYCGTSDADVYCWTFLTGLRGVSFYLLMHGAV